jgi:hypothetical protein
MRADRLTRPCLSPQQVDIDISANYVANYVTGMVRGMIAALEIDIGLVLEGERWGTGPRAPRHRSRAAPSVAQRPIVHDAVRRGAAPQARSPGSSQSGC